MPETDVVFRQITDTSHCCADAAHAAYSRHYFFAIVIFAATPHITPFRH
jgi:hypothetical protein